jgi:hypothetical protein
VAGALALLTVLVITALMEPQILAAAGAVLVLEMAFMVALAAPALSLFVTQIAMPQPHLPQGLRL